MIADRFNDDAEVKQTRLGIRQRAGCALDRAAGADRRPMQGLLDEGFQERALRASPEPMSFALAQMCSGINFFDNGKKLYSEATTDKIWLWSEYHIIRVEVKAGQVTLFHDGVDTIIKQITPHGNDLGFYVVNYENGDLTFSFDDVVVKEIP